MNNFKQVLTNRWFSLFKLLLLSPFMFGLLYPDTWWGTHFIVFIPNPFKHVFIFVSITLFIYSLALKNKEITFKKNWLRNITILSASILSGLIFYSNPIAVDFYGNARSFTAVLDQSVTKLPTSFLKELFSFEFTPGNGRKGVTLLVKLFSFLFDISIYNAFKLMDAICGALFIGTWLYAVKHYIQKSPWQLLIVIIGITSPLLLIFFGHIETYAPVYLILFSWLFLFTTYIKKKRRSLLLILLILLIIGIRLHTLLYLLSPIFLLGILFHQKKENTFFTNLYSIKGMFTKIFIPIMAAGLILYFFIFKDYNDSRKLENFKDIDRLFLPLLSPESPLDRYNLLSLNHIFDYFNMFFLWSPPLLLLLGYLIITKRKAIQWNTPEISLLLLALLLFSTLLFAINPLFSMPMDWDLFMYPVPILLMLLLEISAQVQYINLTKKIFYLNSSFIVWCFPIFIVFFSKQASSFRLESVGIHIFKTYYEHSSTYLLYSLNLDYDRYMERKENIIRKLTPFAILGKDEQFSHLLIDKALNEFYNNKNLYAGRENFLMSLNYYPLPEKFSNVLIQINETLIKQNYLFSKEHINYANEIIQMGIQELNQKNNPKKALELFTLADYYYPLSKEAVFQSVIANFKLKSYTKAYQQTQILIENKYPSHEKSLRMGLHIALEANLYDEALSHTNTIIKQYGNSSMLSEIKKRIEQNHRIDQLKHLFKKQ